MEAEKYMKHKRLIIVLAVLALVTLVGATAAFASSSATQLSQQTAADDVGLVIVSVDPAGPAAAAGVTRGDILISIGGQATNTGQDVTKAVAGLTAGDAVEVVVTHGDEERTLTVTTVDNNGRAYLGIQPYYGMQRAFSPQDEETNEADTGALDNETNESATAGALIVDVVAGSPAESAGLQANDVIVSVDGNSLAEGTSLADAIGAMKPGDTVTLEVQRAGETANLSLDVTLAENPDKAGVAFLGVQYRDTSSNAERMPFGNGGMPFSHGQGMTPGQMPSMPGMPDFGSTQSGVIVVSVAAGSPAEAAGLAEGDVITVVNGKDVATPQDVVDIVAAMKPGQDVTLSTQPADAQESADVTVTLGARPDDSTRAYLGVSLGTFQSMQSQQIVPGQGQFQFQLPFDQGNGTTPPDQGQMPSLPDLLQQLFPGMTTQQNS